MQTKTKIFILKFDDEIELETKNSLSIDMHVNRFALNYARKNDTGTFEIV